MKQPTLLGVKIDECLSCGLIGPHALYRRTFWIHIFWVPVLLVGFSHGMLCSQCGRWTGIPWLAMRRGMKAGRLPLHRTRPRFASLEPDQYGRRPRPEAVLDPLQLNPKRGAWDLYLKVWPAVVAACIVGVAVVLPALRATSPAGRAPVVQAPATQGPVGQGAAGTPRPGTAAGLDWSDLRIGDCFDIEGVDGLHVDPVPSAGTSALIASRVSCAYAHTFEVFARDDDPTPIGTAYPGDDVVFEHADEICDAAFARYVGIDYQASHLSVREWTPTARQWGHGDRRVGCALYDPEKERASGTQRGAFKPYSSPSSEFDISVPAGWTVWPQYGDEPGTLIQGDTSTLLIRVNAAPGTKSDADARQAVEDADRAHLASIAADVTGSTTLTSGGLDWHVTRYTSGAGAGAGAGAGTRVGFDAVAAAGGRMYMLLWESPAFREDADSRLFMEILGSFRAPD